MTKGELRIMTGKVKKDENRMNTWDYYCVQKCVNSFKRRIMKCEVTKYAKRNVLDSKQGNQKIASMLMESKPFVVSRFGSTELAAIVCREAKRINRWAPNKDEHLYEWSGFFPKKAELIDYFTDFMLERIPEVDLLGIWHPSMEEYIIDTYMPNTSLTRLIALEPYYYDEPWTKCLEGKKVLVVHPFTESIQSQYERRDKLFLNKNILPQFELKTLKAVQTLAGTKDNRFRTWFEAYDYMKNMMYEIDYDIAILGCGAYGMPLAIDAKRAGKQAIHLGGATQILFGIKGNRWDCYQPVASLYNDAWIRPSEDEKIENGNKVENNCYW